MDWLLGKAGRGATDAPAAKSWAAENHAGMYLRLAESVDEEFASNEISRPRRLFLIMSAVAIAVFVPLTQAHRAFAHGPKPPKNDMQQPKDAKRPKGDGGGEGDKGDGGDGGDKNKQPSANGKSQASAT